MISVKNIQLSMAGIDPVFKNTPQYRSEGLSQGLGISLYCKVETINPIGSFKGRGASWWFQSQAGSGMKHLVCASAGNFGQAVAYAGRKAKAKVEVFAAETANPIKIQAMQNFGAVVYLCGADFDEAKLAAACYAKEKGIAYLVDGLEDEIAEGAGTIALELGQLDVAYDVVYVPVGNGALINGLGAWFKTESPHTKVVGVCAEAAPSMAQSWQQGKSIATATADTIADGIAVREPIPEALVHFNDVVDDVILVNDSQILTAMRAYYEHEHLVTEPAGAVSLAAAMIQADKHQGKTVVTLVCGANIDPRRQDEWLRNSQNL